MSWLWTDRPFVLFGPAHLVVLVLTAAKAVFLAWLGRRIRRNAARRAPLASEVCQCDPESEPRALRLMRRAFAIGMFVLLVPMQLVTLLPEHFLIGRSLPLQICDIAWMLAIYALWTKSRWAFALVYYWGLTATVLAMITPDLQHGFPSFYFLLFYLGHGSVVVAAVFLCWGVGLRPTWRLYRLTALITILYTVCIYVVNSILGTNFFCANGKPPGTMLDYFGPYPMYIVVSAAIALAAWAALTWPFQARN
jgi:hypothetical integral membrane protein (TIGR02206 family)